jgi:hypothetical protein
VQGNENRASDSIRDPKGSIPVHGDQKDEQKKGEQKRTLMAERRQSLRLKNREASLIKLAGAHTPQDIGTINQPKRFDATKPGGKVSTTRGTRQKL